MPCEDERRRVERGNGDHSRCVRSFSFSSWYLEEADPFPRIQKGQTPWGVRHDLFPSGKRFNGGSKPFAKENLMIAWCPFVDPLTNLRNNNSAIKIGANHHRNKLRKTDGRLPTKFIPGFGGIPQQQVDLCRSKEPRIDFDQYFSVGTNPLFIHTFTTPGNRPVDLREGKLTKFANRMGLARCNHKIVRFLSLKNSSHGVNIIAGKPPVALSVEIS